MKALERFSHPNKGHKHLVRLLLSYELAGEFFMIFPWAQGNLAQFWETNPSNPESRDDLSWFIQQCQGMANGLRKVHKDNSWPPRRCSIGDTSLVDARNRGRHGDIKPENILFFAEAGQARGHLVIADFTLMRFHSMDTVDCTEASKVGFSRTYCPPEVEAGPRTSVNQKYDIWTLGCVYLEFITWYLIGYDAIRKDCFKSPSGELLESFNMVRLNDDKKHGVHTDKFFNQTDGSGAEVKNSVVKVSRSRLWAFDYWANHHQWISMLHGKQHCSRALHDFLDLVEKRMLAPLPNDRCSMAQVDAELTKILNDCQDDQKCHVGDPRLISNNENFPPKFTKQVYYSFTTRRIIY